MSKRQSSANQPRTTRSRAAVGLFRGIFGAAEPEDETEK